MNNLRVYRTHKPAKPAKSAHDNTATSLNAYNNQRPCWLMHRVVGYKFPHKHDRRTARSCARNPILKHPPKHSPSSVSFFFVFLLSHISKLGRANKVSLHLSKSLVMLFVSPDMLYAVTTFTFNLAHISICPHIHHVYILLSLSRVYKPEWHIVN